MYILAEFLNAILDFNLQFFIDLILNNLVWLFIFAVLAAVFYSKKGLIVGTIFVALGVFLFTDLLALFNAPLLLAVVPLTFVLIAGVVSVWIEGTKFENSFVFWFALALFLGWLLV